jgi:hypothetical protein
VVGRFRYFVFGGLCEESGDRLLSDTCHGAMLSYVAILTCLYFSVPKSGVAGP